MINPIPPHQKLVAIVMAVALFASVYELVRRRRLREEYAWIWLLAAGGIVLFASVPQVLYGLTRLLGATIPASTMYFIGIFFLMMVCLQLCVRASQLARRVKDLAQELALLRQATETTRPTPTAPPAPTVPPTPPPPTAS